MMNTGLGQPGKTYCDYNTKSSLDHPGEGLELYLSHCLRHQSLCSFPKRARSGAPSGPQVTKREPKGNKMEAPGLQH